MRSHCYNDLGMANMQPHFGLGMVVFFFLLGFSNLAAAVRRGSFSISPLAQPESEDWLRDALRSCTDIRADAPWMPDYQG